MPSAQAAKKKAKLKGEAVPQKPPKREEIPGDLYHRTKDEKHADLAFQEALGGFDRFRNPSLSAKYAFAPPGAFLEVIRRKGDAQTTEQIPLISGIYPLAEAAELGGKLAKEKLDAKGIASALFEQLAVKRAVVIREIAEYIGSRNDAFVAATPTDVVKVRVDALPILGTALLFNSSGDIQFDVVDSAEEFLNHLPAFRRGYYPSNPWCTDLPTTEVADMATRAREVLLNLRAQLSLLGSEADVYSVSPRHLRYYSDGDMSTQREGNHGLRLAPYLGDGARPLLYDGPAWCVGLRIGKKIIPGRVFVNDQGEFICSDWCQREVDKSGGIDLITGKNTKHTLLTWTAGPGMSRFNSDSKEHQVRRLKKAAKSHGLIKRRLLQHGVKLLRNVAHPESGMLEWANVTGLVNIHAGVGLQTAEIGITVPSEHAKMGGPHTTRLFVAYNGLGTVTFGFVAAVVRAGSVIPTAITFRKNFQDKSLAVGDVAKGLPGKGTDSIKEGHPSYYYQAGITDEALRNDVHELLRKLP